MMTINQLEKFILGYPYPTDYVELILKKYNYDIEKENKLLCKPYSKVVNAVQKELDPF